MTPKLTPDEAWQALEQLAAEEDAAEVERVDALTGPELDRELAKEGLDPEAGRAHALAAIRKVQSSRERREGEAPAKAVPIRPVAIRLSAKVAAAAAVLGPVGYLALAELAEPLTLVAAAPDGGADKALADSLRSEAANALEAGQWARCLALLDEAKKKDPLGDDAPGVKDVRRIAMGKLGMLDGAVAPH